MKRTRESRATSSLSLCYHKSKQPEFFTWLPSELWPKIFLLVGDGLWSIAHVSKYMFQFVLDILDNPVEFYRDCYKNFIVHIAKYGYANLLDWTMSSHGLYFNVNLICLRGPLVHNTSSAIEILNIPLNYGPQIELMKQYGVRPGIIYHICFPLHVGTDRMKFIERVLRWIGDHRQFFYVLTRVSAELGDLELFSYALQKSRSYSEISGCTEELSNRRIRGGSCAMGNSKIMTDVRYSSQVILTHHFETSLLPSIMVGGNIEIYNLAREFQIFDSDINDYSELICYSGNVKMLELRGLPPERITEGHLESIFMRTASCGHLHVFEWFKSHIEYGRHLLRFARAIITTAATSNKPKVIDWMLENFPTSFNPGGVLGRSDFVVGKRTFEMLIESDKLDTIKWLDKKFPNPRFYDAVNLRDTGEKFSNPRFHDAGILRHTGENLYLFSAAIYANSEEICQWCVDEKFEWPPFAVLRKIISDGTFTKYTRKLINAGCPDTASPLFKLASYEFKFIEDYCTRSNIVLTSDEEAFEYRKTMEEYLKGISIRLNRNIETFVYLEVLKVHGINVTDNVILEYNIK